MPDLVAVLSQVRFDSEAKRLKPGDVFPISRYTNLELRNAPLDAHARAGRLVLFTVRPTGALWLIAVMNAPKNGMYEFTSSPNRVPIRDFSAFRTQLGFDGERAQGPERPPRLLDHEQLKIILGPDAIPSVDDANARYVETMRAAQHEVEMRAARVGLSMPPLLTILFEAAMNRSWYEALQTLGIDLMSSAYDIIGEAEPYILGRRDDEQDESAEQRRHRKLLPRFVGFATSGSGDVYGLVAAANSDDIPCVLRFFHEDEHFEHVGNDFEDWLAGFFRDVSDPAVADDEGLAMLVVVRSRLPPLAEPIADARAPGWLAPLIAE